MRRTGLNCLLVLCLSFVGCSDDQSASESSKNPADMEAIGDAAVDDQDRVGDMTTDAAANQDLGGDASDIDGGLEPDMTGDMSSAADMESADMSASDMTSEDMAPADAGGDMATAPDDGVVFKCPTPRPSEGFCTQVIAWAKDPDTGNCCRYPTPCNAPEGWQTYPNEGACQAI